MNNDFYLQRSNISSAVMNVALYECKRPGASSSPWESDVEPTSRNICLDPIPLKLSSSRITEWTLYMLSKRKKNQKGVTISVYNKLKKTLMNHLEEDGSASQNPTSEVVSQPPFEVVSQPPFEVVSQPLFNPAREGWWFSCTSSFGSKLSKMRLSEKDLEWFGL